MTTSDNQYTGQEMETMNKPTDDDRDSCASHCSKVSFGTVTISGPGRTFCDVVLAVVDGMTAAGAIVDLENEYPPDQEHVAMLCERLKGRRVTVKVDHLPWGG